MDSTPTDLQAWRQALDELEAFIGLTDEQVSAGQPIETKAWAAPDLGPMPAELAERAGELLSYQQRVLDRIPAALAKLQQQRSATDRFVQATHRQRSVPVYIDRTA